MGKIGNRPLNHGWDNTGRLRSFISSESNFLLGFNNEESHIQKGMSYYHEMSPT